MLQVLCYLRTLVLAAGAALSSAWSLVLQRAARTSLTLQGTCQSPDVWGTDILMQICRFETPRSCWASPREGRGVVSTELDLSWALAKGFIPGAAVKHFMVHYPHSRKQCLTLELNILTRIFIHLIFLWLCQQSLIFTPLFPHCILGSKTSCVSVSMNGIFCTKFHIWDLFPGLWDTGWPACESYSVSLWFFEAQTPELHTSLWRALGFVQVAETASLLGSLLLLDWVDLAAFCHSRDRKSHWAKNHFPEGLSREPLLQMFPHWQVHFEMSHWIHI